MVLEGAGKAIEAAAHLAEATEGKLVGDYRATSDRYKPDVSHYAEDMAARHPKNKGAGAPLRREGAA